MRLRRGVPSVRGTRANGVFLVLLGLASGFVAAGCDTSSATKSAPTPTATPHSVVSYTCAAKNFPIGSAYTQKTCTVSQVNNAQMLRATYAAPQKQGSANVDTSKLKADGWQIIDQQSAGRSPSSRTGDALYFNQSAWLTYHFDNPAGTLSLEEVLPSDAKAVVRCGQSLTSGTAERQGLPLPSGALTTDAGVYTIVPACLNDVTTYYHGALSTAGWMSAQDFEATPAANTQTTAMLGKFSHNGTTLAIWLAGASGASTAMVVRTNT